MNENCLLLLIFVILVLFEAILLLNSERIRKMIKQRRGTAREKRHEEEQKARHGAQDAELAMRNIELERQYRELRECIEAQMQDNAEALDALRSLSEVSWRDGFK